MGLDATETTTFSSVATRGYFNAITEVSGPLADTGSFGITAQNSLSTTAVDLYSKLPNIAGIRRVLTGRPYGPAATYFVSDDYISDADDQALLQTKLDNIPDSVLTKATISGSINRHVYQPYFPTSELKKIPSPYTALTNIQGHRNTYYVGALFTFAEHGKIIEHAYQLVNKFF